MFIPDMPQGEFDGNTNIGNNIYNIGHKRAKAIWEKHVHYFQEFDVILTSDTVPLSRIFLQNFPETKLVIWVCNRFDYYDSKSLDCEFPDAEFYNLLNGRNLQNVKVIHYTNFESIYALSKKTNLGTTIIKPIGLIDRHQESKSYPNTFFIIPYENETKFINLQLECKQHGIETICIRYDGPNELKNFKALIHLPYAWSNVALFENWANGMVYFLPSKTFILRMMATGKYWFQNSEHFLQSSDLSEWYNPNHSHLFVYFDSWTDLAKLSQTTNLEPIQSNILDFMKIHDGKMIELWKHTFNEVMGTGHPIDKFGGYMQKMHTTQMDFSMFGKTPLCRYDTLKYCFERLPKNPVIVELGTSRSFVDGAFEGCNSNDAKYWEPTNPSKWDWGAGCFTLMVPHCVEQPFKFHTIDLCKDHINRSQIMTQQFKNIYYHVSTSEKFLNEFSGKIDLLYIDTGDMTPIGPTSELQLREAKIIIERNLLNENGLILIDDIMSPATFYANEFHPWGKAKESLPYFFTHGFELVMAEYQYILQKKKIK
jgi:hypothetical protein